jgi:hypothetical protein
MPVKFLEIEADFIFQLVVLRTVWLTQSPVLIVIYK